MRGSSSFSVLPLVDQRRSALASGVPPHFKPILASSRLIASAPQAASSSEADLCCSTSTRTAASLTLVVALAGTAAFVVVDAAPASDSRSPALVAGSTRCLFAGRGASLAAAAGDEPSAWLCLAASAAAAALWRFFAATIPIATPCPTVSRTLSTWLRRRTFHVTPSACDRPPHECTSTVGADMWRVRSTPSVFCHFCLSSGARGLEALPLERFPVAQAGHRSVSLGVGQRGG
jgi:hypothetical protein